MKKLALITGANGNLGKEVVKKFINDGYYVVGFVHKIKPGKLQSDSYEEIELDLLGENLVQKNIDSIIEKHQKIDVAILTAGGFAMNNIHNSSAQDILDQYKLNFETAYNVARPAFINMLEKNYGRIFLIGSKQGLNVLKGKESLAYALSKSLIFRLAELLNSQAKGKNVVVSVIVPGTIDTSENRKSMPDADFTAWTKSSKIADVISKYCSSEFDDIREPVIKMFNKS